MPSSPQDDETEYLLSYPEENVQADPMPPVSDDDVPAGEAQAPVDPVSPEDPHAEAPPAEPPVPLYRPFRPVPSGVRIMFTPRKRTLPPPAPVAPEAPEPPKKKLLKRLQSRRRTYLPTVDGFLAYSDEDSDDEIPSIFEIGGPSQPPADAPMPTGFEPFPVRHTLYSVRDIVGRHDTQVRVLAERIQDLEDDLYLGGRTRDPVLSTLADLSARVSEAERRRANAESRVAELELRLEEMDQRMRAAVAALAAAFPPPPQ